MKRNSSIVISLFILFILFFSLGMQSGRVTASKSIPDNLKYEISIVSIDELDEFGGAHASNPSISSTGNLIAFEANFESADAEARFIYRKNMIQGGLDQIFSSFFKKMCKMRLKIEPTPYTRPLHCSTN